MKLDEYYVVVEQVIRYMKYTNMPYDRCLFECGEATGIGPFTQEEKEHIAAFVLEYWGKI